VRPKVMYRTHATYRIRLESCSQYVAPPDMVAGYASTVASWVNAYRVSQQGDLLDELITDFLRVIHRLERNAVVINRWRRWDISPRRNRWRLRIFLTSVLQLLQHRC